MSAEPAQLDWAGMLRAGLRDLGLHPDQFWTLTPAELALMLGLETGEAAMTRARLDDLAARFPDFGPASRGPQGAAARGQRGRGPQMTGGDDGR